MIRTAGGRESLSEAARPGMGFYGRWVAANGWSEALGLGTTFLAGRFLGPRLGGATGLAEALLTAAAAIALGTLLEGALVGIAQESVLRRRLGGLRRGMWVLATAAGAGAAWVIGMVPSTVMALLAPSGGVSPPQEPPVLVKYALASALGLATGPVLGLAQALVLRRHAPRAGRWLLANAAAWAVGMPLIFLGMERVPWMAPPAAMIPAVYAVCAGAGLAVGAIHGWALVRMIPPRPAG